MWHNTNNEFVIIAGTAGSKKRLMHLSRIETMSLLWLMSTAAMSAEAWHGSVPPSSLPPPFNFSSDAVAMCPCPNSTSLNGTRVDSMSANAIKMQEALRDKPTVIHKIHHRLTHSRDAQGAALAVFGLMALVLVAVYLSKMWRDKSSLAYVGKQAINYEQNTKKVEILVKDMLKERARSLTRIFSRRRRGEYAPRQRISADSRNSLKMETFVRHSGDDSGDAVDGISPSLDEDDARYHRRFLESSSGSEEDIGEWARGEAAEADSFAYAINRQTGEWAQGSGRAGVARRRQGNPQVSAPPPRRQRPFLDSLLSRVRSGGGGDSAAASFSRSDKKAFGASMKNDGSDVLLLAESDSDEE